MADSYLKYRRVVVSAAADPFNDSRPLLKTATTSNLMFILDAAITNLHGREQLEEDSGVSTVLSVAVKAGDTKATVVACEDQSHAYTYAIVATAIDPKTHLPIVTKKKVILSPTGNANPKFETTMWLENGTWRAAATRLLGPC